MTMRLRRCLQATLEDNEVILLLHSMVNEVFLGDKSSHHTFHASAEQTVSCAACTA
jgi:hypothetical protein